MKILMLLLVSALLMPLEDYLGLEDCTGYFELSNGEKVNLTIGKIQQSLTSGMSYEEKLAAKNIETVVQIESKENMSFVVKSPKTMSPRFALIKLEESKGKYISVYRSSVLKPDNNKSMQFITTSFQELKKELGIYRMTVSEKLSQGRYVIVFGQSNGKGFGAGFIDSKQAVFFDVI